MNHTGVVSNPAEEVGVTVEVTALTRTKMADRVGVSRDVLLHWERAGLVSPSGRTGSGPTHAALYRLEDHLQVEVVAALHTLGVAARQAHDLLAACEGIELIPGWEGWLVLRPNSPALVEHGDLEPVLRSHRKHAAVVAVKVPETVRPSFPQLRPSQSLKRQTV